METTFTIEPIGYIQTPYKSKQESPKRGGYNSEKICQVKILEKFLPGLKGLTVGKLYDFIFFFDQLSDYHLQTIPYKKTEETGVFNCRTPRRPNHLGLTTVKIISIKDNLIEFTGADMLDQTPLIDIKPHIFSEDLATPVL